MIDNSYVAQEPSLFPGSIRSNIASGKAETDGPATDQEVIDAAKAACAHDFIMDLPDKYDTFFSGASMQLSGGQIQVRELMLRLLFVLNHFVLLV